MKAKWLIAILITGLFLLGINQNQVFTPNQEIVLKFNSQVTTNKTQDAIAILKEQLQNLGAQNIKLLEESSGELKITYHSDLDVSDIKKRLSENHNLQLGYTTHSENQPLKSSNNKDDIYLDVYEIVDGNDVNLDSKGYVFEIKLDNDRSFNPKLHVFSNNFDYKEKQDLDETRIKFYKTIAVAIKNTSYKIPEVRAGPLV